MGRVASRPALAARVARAALTAAALAALALLAGCGGATRQPAAAAPGSTLRATLVDPDGDGFLERGPREPLRARGELPVGRAGRTLATFGQLTDTHVRDEESPARAPFLDRLGPPFTSTFRPQEATSAQVLDAAVRAVDRERPQAVFVTGDIVDSAQQNELDEALAVLRGTRVDPDSGRPGYTGVQEADSPDPFFYRPDVDAPRHPGLLAAAQRPFRARGLDAPWYPAVGNHDVLVQGEVPATPAIERVATGNRLVATLDPDLRPPRAEAGAAAAVAAALAGGTVASGRAVPADPQRRHLDAPTVVARLASAAGVRPARADRLDYAVDVGPALRAIVLDTVDRDGGSRGRLDPLQIGWLRNALARAGSRWIVVFSHNPLEATDGGAAALAALDATPRVVAVVAGNRHRNTIEPRRIAGGGGYWLIGTSSLADWPQQARMFRLRAAADGGAVLETWMVDQEGRGVAGVARELAYLDAQGGRPAGFAGRRGDRNAVLGVPPR
jgi:3',5'-cyclic AMP phosphodiesterase CpdA